MEAIEINLTYPFLVNRSFLIHTDTLEKRFKLFSRWIDWLKDADKHLAYTTVNSQIIYLLKAFDWELRIDPTIAHLIDPDITISNFKSRYLPVNLNNSKGGVLTGSLNLDINAIWENNNEWDFVESVPIKNENGQSPRALLPDSIKQKKEVFKLLIEYFNLSTDVETTKKLKNISVEIHFYDWNICALDISFFIQESDLIKCDIVNLNKQIQNLQGINIKTLPKEERKENAHFWDKWCQKGKLLYPYDEEIQKRKFESVSPLFFFFEELFFGFSSVIPLPKLEEDDGKFPISDYCVILNFFSYPLKKIQNIADKEEKRDEKELQKSEITESSLLIWKPDNPRYRLNYFSARIILYTKSPKVLSKQLSPNLKLLELLETNTNFGSMLLPNPIYRIESGFNTSLIIVSTQNDDRIDALLFQPTLRKVKWFWKLGYMYFAGIHRLQNEVLKRMNENIELGSFIRNKLSKLGENDDIPTELEKYRKLLREEINTLLGLGLAITIATREFSKTNVCDEHIYINLYDKMEKDFSMEKLFTNAGSPISQMVFELESILKIFETKISGKNEKSLEGLKFATFLSIGLTSTIIVAKLWDSVFENIKPFIQGCPWVDEVVYYLVYLLLIFGITILIYRTNFKVFRNEPAKGLLGKIRKRLRKVLLLHIDESKGEKMNSQK